MVAINTESTGSMSVREQTGVYDPLTIGEDTWIGERATVAASVGRHCVVGAGALVLTAVPDFAIVAGVPARIIGDRRKVAEAAQAKSREPSETETERPVKASEGGDHQ